MHWLLVILITLMSLVVTLVSIEYISKYAIRKPNHRIEQKRSEVPKTAYTTAHFVYGLWDTSPIPENFQNTMYLWEKQGWKVKLWNKEMVDSLLDEYPDYKQLIPSFTRKVQIADLARLLILFKEGGHYFDLDCVPTKENLFVHLNEFGPNNVFYQECVKGYISSMLVGITKRIRKWSPEQTSRIANFAFGARPNDPVIKRNLELLRFRCMQFADQHTDYDVIFKTGPDCTTTVVHEASDKVVLENRVWMRHIATGTWKHQGDIQQTEIQVLPKSE
uniref:Glycosyltransferase n=1 Tax=viral metagenome TaxID=1070528 RepID=A0A6C0CMR1_9ZZZZ